MPLLLIGLLQRYIAELCLCRK